MVATNGFMLDNSGLIFYHGTHNTALGELNYYKISAAMSTRMQKRADRMNNKQLLLKKSYLILRDAKLQVSEPMF